MNRPNYQNTPDTFFPAWASAYGQDGFGYWADLLLNYNSEVTQRFRWIPAGEFMMGSPEGEAGRNDNEGYHQETLTQGFWLADTACSQAFWQAVMGDNPARFKLSEQHPVETVSWREVETFIQQLNERIHLLNATLPTEAQWEYACRAATTSAFNMGDSISSDEVNFDGNYPYGGAAKGSYLEETVAVKTLNQNDWGLYQMHGNVSEWCQDNWQAELGTAAVTDPINIMGGKEGGRVVRGGSWRSNGRNCRSAHRNCIGAAMNRNILIGFRLALGQEL